MDTLNSEAILGVLQLLVGWSLLFLVSFSWLTHISTSEINCVNVNSERPDVTRLRSDQYRLEG